MRAVVLLLIAACSGPGEIDPGDATPQDLYGTWKIEGTDSEDRPRYLSFYERFDAHPMVEGVPNVHLRYLVDASGTQMLLEVGTYAVVDGTLELTPLGGLSPNDRPYAATIAITNLAPDSYLELAGISGSPVAHTRLARCDSPAFADGWIGYDLSRAVYEFTNIGGGPQAMTLSYLSDGTLVGGARTGYFRFDKECVPETVGRGGTGERIVLKTSDGVILATGPAFGASSPVRYGRLRAGDALSGVTWRELAVQEADARVFGVVADQLVVAYRTQSPPGYAVAVDDGSATTVTQLPEFFTPGTIADDGGTPLVIGRGTPMAALTVTPSGLVASAIPVANPGYLAAATEGDKVWLVYDEGGEPGEVASARELWLITREGDTWSTPRYLGWGAKPTLVVLDGVAHVAYAAPTGDWSAVYSRVTDDRIEQWSVPPWGGFGEPTLSIKSYPAAIDVASDGSIAVGFGGFVQVLPPGAMDSRRAEVRFEISGAGTIRSSDGVVQCDASCTITTEAGRRLLVELLPAQAGVASHTCPGGAPGSPLCVVAVGGLNDAVPTNQTVTITFP